MQSTRTHEPTRKVTPGYGLGSFIIAQFDHCIELANRRAERKGIMPYGPEMLRWRRQKVNSVDMAMTSLLNPTNYPEFYQPENIGNSQAE